MPSAAPTTAIFKRRATTLRKRFESAIPEPQCELDWENPWQLLIAVILSAQSTDKMVNRVTPALFDLWPDPPTLAAARREELEQVVRPTGFFRNKAKSIQGSSALIVSQHGGQVPREMAALLALPGVARKTANVVLGTAFGIASGITVDTHAGRVARKLELTAATDPVKVERDLCALFPRKHWVAMSHRLVLHGRYICTARKPDCVACPLNEHCAAAEAKPTGKWAERAAAEAHKVATRGGQRPA